MVSIYALLLTIYIPQYLRTDCLSNLYTVYLVIFECLDFREFVILRLTFHEI